MRECDSGNAGYGMHFASGAPLDLIEVKVITRTLDGIDVPKTISLPTGRVHRIDRVLGAKRVLYPCSAMQYAVRIGSRHTLILLRDDGVWLAERDLNARA